MKSPHLKEQFALCPNSGSNKKDQINSATVCPVYSAKRENWNKKFSSGVFENF